INIYAHASSDEAAKKMLNKKVRQYRELLGEYIFSENGEELEEVVMGMLIKSGHKLALAESCTGGLLAGRLTSVPGASKVFEYGAVTYTNKCKQAALGVDSSILRKYSAVSSAVAAEMAKGALAKSKADIALAVTGIAGPTNEGYIDKPVGLVYIALADKSRVLVKKFNFGNKRSRENVREMSVHNALDMLRRHLAGLKIEGAREFGPGDIADMDKKGRARKKSSLAVEKGLVSLLLLALVGTGVFAGVRALRSRLYESVYSAVQTSANSLQTTDALFSMREQNPDAYAWLTTDGGALDCVVVEDDGSGYYADHDFSGSRNALGCPYVVLPEDGSQPSNLVIYGTSGDTSQVFGPLRAYLGDDGLSLAQSDYLFNLTTESGIASYKLAAVFIANDSEENGDVTDFYKAQNFASEEEFVNFVIEMKMRSVISVNTSIISSDSFITLVSDLGGWEGEKLVIVARRLREGEAATISAESISRNFAALYPEKYYELNGGSSNLNLVIERDRWRNWLSANEKNAGETEEVYAANGGLIRQNGSAAESPSLSSDGEVVISVIMNGSELTDTPLNIVGRMVAYELDDSYEDETVKALAVACNSWLRYAFDIGIKPSVSGKSPSDNILNLTSQVINEGVYFEEDFAFTPFFMISAGRTNSAAEVFGEDYAYLQSVESRYDYQLRDYSSSASFARDALKSRLEAYYSLSLSDDSENWIQVLSLTSGGCADEVSIDGQALTSGQELALSCLGLNSACFDLSWSGSQAVFAVRGEGHGVGLSVGGANEYAIAMGWDYKAILGHYYSGITIGEMMWSA
ncbi:MAG: nicotinamide-nucleotide amidohydrolase family protein, partial [Oscillospiraceae bacterium]|nr:nicotinamide-nucleotide amidohydrolase family protein [Oscillospiraceae bacterium]